MLIDYVISQWYILLFLVWCRHFSTTASNTISLWACLWEKICTHIYISTLHTQNCQIRTKDSVWAHCVTVRGLRCPAGQAACKFIAISIISLEMAFLQDTSYSHKVHNLNPYRKNAYKMPLYCMCCLIDKMYYLVDSSLNHDRHSNIF